jgi:hypothetical protein
MSESDMQAGFVSEPIEPAAGTFDNRAMARFRRKQAAQWA